MQSLTFPKTNSVLILQYNVNSETCTHQKSTYKKKKKEYIQLSEFSQTEHKYIARS